MGKSKSLLKLNGKTDDLVFYRLGNKEVVRSRDRQQGDRLKRDGRFAQVRKVQSEFGLSSRVGKLLRVCLGEHLDVVKDVDFSGRLTGLLFDILKQDAQPKGKRKICIEQYGDLLKGFEFNAEKKLSRHFWGIIEKRRTGNGFEVKIKCGKIKQIYKDADVVLWCCAIRLPVCIDGKNAPQKLRREVFEMGCLGGKKMKRMVRCKADECVLLGVMLLYQSRGRVIGSGGGMWG